ncbi:MAG: hypothetical protein WAU68_17385 [Vitreimonas sp.]
MGDNLAKRIFLRSILPQIADYPRFRSLLASGAKSVSGRTAYPIDTKRFDLFFDALTSAVFFDRFGVRLDESVFQMRHIYLSFHSDDEELALGQKRARSMLATFFERFSSAIEHFEAAKIDDVIYGNTIIAPLGDQASVTVGHTFYGTFEVVSLLTQTRVNQAVVGSLSPME